MPVIDRQNRLPLYQQVYEQIKRRIAGGEWQPGQMLPPESQLMLELDVSRITMRQALSALAREGLIHRQRGRGTLVAHPTVEQGLMRIIPFEQDMISRGLTPSTRVLKAHLVQASKATAAELSMPEGDDLVRIEQLHLADGEPMSLEELYLVHQRVPGLLQKAIRSVSLRELLAKDYGILCSHARQVIRAAAAKPHQARALRVRNGFPLLYIERTGYSQHREPLQYVRIFHRGDRYALRAEVSG